MSNEVIDKFNELLGYYWTAYAQHKAHLVLVEDWGYSKLAETMAEHISDEPDTIEKLQKRILDLGGKIDFRLGEVKIGTTIGEALRTDLVSSPKLREAFYGLIELMHQGRDAKSRMMLETILDEEEEHALWLESELDLLERLGEQLYLAARV